MSNISDILFRMGVGTWVADIITVIPNPTTKSFQVGKNLPTDVGFIYGLSMYADGVDSQNNTLITSTQAQNMYLQLQDGPTQFLEEFRLSTLLDQIAGSPVVRPDKFTPVNIPTFDLSKSNYLNPLLYTTASLRLKLWYVNTHDWKKVEKYIPMQPQAETNQKSTSTKQ